MDSISLIVLAVALVFGIIIYAIISTREHKRPKGVDPRIVRAKWEKIAASASDLRPDNLKLAIIDADKLLDSVLKALGYRGETLGERLKSSENHYSDVNGIWRAHKLRNQIVHDEDVDLVISQARDAMHEYRKALRDLGVL